MWNDISTFGNWLKTTVGAIVGGIVCGLIICVFLNMCSGTKVVTEVKRDTLVITKTDTFVSPIYKTSLVVRKDTVALPFVTDVYIDRLVRDTVMVEVPIERRIYSDSTYYAVVSGYNPNLDSIMIRNKFMTITENKIERIKVNKKWGLGVQAGGGISTDGKIYPYIGIGVSYNILNW